MWSFISTPSDIHGKITEYTGLEESSRSKRFRKRDVATLQGHGEGSAKENIGFKQKLEGRRVEPPDPQVSHEPIIRGGTMGGPGGPPLPPYPLKNVGMLHNSNYP